MNTRKFILIVLVIFVFGGLGVWSMLNPSPNAQPAPAAAIDASGVWTYPCPGKGQTYTEPDPVAQARFNNQYSPQGLTGFEGWQREASVVCGDQPQVAAGPQINWTEILGDNLGLVIGGAIVFLAFIVLIIKTRKLDVGLVGAGVAWGVLLLISGDWFVLWSFQSGMLILGLLYVLVRSNFQFFSTYVTVKNGDGAEASATIRSMGRGVADAHERQVDSLMTHLPAAIQALPAPARRRLPRNLRALPPGQQWKVVQDLADQYVGDAPALPAPRGGNVPGRGDGQWRPDPNNPGQAVFVPNYDEEWDPDEPGEDPLWRYAAYKEVAWLPNSFWGHVPFQHQWARWTLEERYRWLCHNRQHYQPEPLNPYEE